MSLNVNYMFRDEITKITNSLIPPGFEGDVRSIRDYNVSYRLMQECVAREVDALGTHSAVTQALNKVITTAARLRTADNHTLYLYKDAAAQQGRGKLVGLLKVARKHLFLADQAGRVLELEPLCVLDFFVLPSHQRHGVGKKLFDHMLQDQGTAVHQLAVDGPSDLMVSFLRRQYGVPRLLRQNNNFAVAPAFFDDLAPTVSARAGGGSAAVGRYSSARPQSTIAKVIHGSPVGNLKGTQARDVDWRPAHSAQLRSTTYCKESRAPALPSPAAPVSPAAPAVGGAAHGCSPPRPRTLPVSAASPAPPPAAPAPPPAPAAAATQTPAGAPSRADSQLTDKGFFDVKFYHKKLW